MGGTPPRNAVADAASDQMLGPPSPDGMRCSFSGWYPRSLPLPPPPMTAAPADAAQRPATESGAKEEEEEASMAAMAGYRLVRLGPRGWGW